MTFLTEDEWQSYGDAPFLRRTDRQFHWINQGFATFDDFLGALASRKRKALKKERREAVCRRHRHPAAHRRRHHGKALGRVLHLLPGHRQPQMGQPLSQPPLFQPDRRADGGRDHAGDVLAGWPDDRRGAEFHRRRRALRPLLGMPGEPPVPAFRDLLLPGHRLRHRARPFAGGSRARKASTSWRAAMSRRSPTACIISFIRA